MPAAEQPPLPPRSRPRLARHAGPPLPRLGLCAALAWSWPVAATAAATGAGGPGRAEPRTAQKAAEGGASRGAPTHRLRMDCREGKLPALKDEEGKKGPEDAASGGRPVGAEADDAPDGKESSQAADSAMRGKELWKRAEAAVGGASPRGGVRAGGAADEGRDPCLQGRLLRLSADEGARLGRRLREQGLPLVLEPLEGARELEASRDAVSKASGRMGRALESLRPPLPVDSLDRIKRMSPAPAVPAPLQRVKAVLDKSAGPGEPKPPASWDTLFHVMERPKAGGGTERLLVLKKEQLAGRKRFLLNATVAKGTGKELLSTMMDRMMMGGTMLVAFEPMGGGHVKLVQVQEEVRAAPGTPEARMVERSLPDRVLAILPVASRGKKGDWVSVSLDDLALSDPTGIRKQAGGDAFPGLSNPGSIQGILKQVDSFKRNLGVDAELVAGGGDGPGTIHMRYDLAALPEIPFEALPADPRLGHFTEDYEDLSDPGRKHDDHPAQHLVRRWRLEKTNPKAPVSDVKQPLTYWLSDSVPEEYREPVKAGILAWNKAFEAAGFRNAVVVKDVAELPEEERGRLNPYDISRNMVHWFTAENAGFAVGPTRADPRTGEIFHGAISIGDQITRLSEKLAQSGLDTLASSWTGKERTEEALRSRARLDAAAAMVALEAAPTGPEERRRFVAQVVRFVALHEFGHELGLRHDFGASARVGAGEVPASAMDYPAPNLAPPGKPQGDYYPQAPGPGDRLALAYAYGTPEQRRAALAQARGYHTDEDALGGYDPDAQAGDVSGPLVDGAQDRVRRARGLWASLSDFDARSADPRALERLAAGVQLYAGAVAQVLPLVGGVRSEHGRATKFQPVSAQEQREALGFLGRDLFDPRNFALPPGALAMAGANRLDRPLQGPVAWTESVGRLQGLAIGHLFDDGTLRRLGQGGLLSGEPGGSLSAGEMMERVRQGIWQETLEGGESSWGRYDVRGVSSELGRGLQRRHVEALARTASEAGGAPGDARLAARAQLQLLESKLAYSQLWLADEVTKHHLAQTRERIRRALDPPQPSGWLARGQAEEAQ